MIPKSNVCCPCKKEGVHIEIHGDKGHVKMEREIGANQLPDEER